MSTLTQNNPTNCQNDTETKPFAKENQNFNRQVKSLNIALKSQIAKLVTIIVFNLIYSEVLL